jgi:hypothetical protein
MIRNLWRTFRDAFMRAFAREATRAQREELSQSERECLAAMAQLDKARAEFLSALVIGVDLGRNRQQNEGPVRVVHFEETARKPKTWLH